MIINGIVLLNKERGISSNKAVNKVKYLIGADKAGHLGTLDVLGEGLLPITLGKGTKLFDYYLNKDKIYRTVFKFGETTDTLDLEGEITDQNDVILSKDDILRILPKLVGKQNQMPPKYSAKKINGATAYDLARKGVDFQLKPKQIQIYSIKLLKQLDVNIFEFEIHCSSGTYIRSICRDMATELSTYGVMLSIQRTKCGDFEIKDASSIEDVQKNNFNIISLDKLFDLPKFEFDEEKGKKLLNGCKVHTNLGDGDFKGYVNGEFIGICHVDNKKVAISLRLI